MRSILPCSDSRAIPSSPFTSVPTMSLLNCRDMSHLSSQWSGPLRIIRQTGSSLLELPSPSRGTGNTNGQMAGSRQGRYTHRLAGTEALYPKRGGTGLRPPTPLPAGASPRACLLGNQTESQGAPSFPAWLHTYTKTSSFCRLNAPQNHPLLFLLHPH